jgi:cell wall-associated NlpC family hydrolase
MDCSGFVQKVFTDHGIRMPRTADLQFEVGQVVPRGSEQPGDLVFFETYCPGASHVGVYLGRSQFVHASSGAGYITIGTLRDEYFSRCYLGARRNW